MSSYNSLLCLAFSTMGWRAQKRFATEIVSLSVPAVGSISQTRTCCWNAYWKEHPVYGLSCMQSDLHINVQCTYTVCARILCHGCSSSKHRGFLSVSLYCCSNVFPYLVLCLCIHLSTSIYIRLLESASLIISPTSTVERVLSHLLLLCPLSGPSKPVCDIKEWPFHFIPTSEGPNVLLAHGESWKVEQNSWVKSDRGLIKWCQQQFISGQGKTAINFGTERASKRKVSITFVELYTQTNICMHTLLLLLGRCEVTLSLTKA